ncbi:hypothetical protein [Legionella fairfieldensis]|uniref:hypothetical protein n=1 Tax=Legionella fairfieldensis TaxID=45064 RepID=UPI000AD639D3|nr:hypothetical protein [Legionella fairfieldensis]
MEKEERVLAYTLAKEIDYKDLDEVSGGSVQTTAQVTGNVSSPDGAGDVTVDW